MEDDLFPSSDEDDEWVEPPKSKKSKDPMGRRPPRSKKAAGSGTRRQNRQQNSEPTSGRRRRSRSGPIYVDNAPKAFKDVDPNDLEHSPSGSKCRFVRHKEITGRILLPETYLQPGEAGVLTFLLNFRPGDRNFRQFEYFGYHSEIARTRLSDIAKMTDEDLEAQIAQGEAELQTLPLPTHNETVAIPGFSTSLTDSIAINADVRTFNWRGFGAVQKFDVIVMDPPWQIAVATMTRGVTISYDQLDAGTIAKMPLGEIQTDGYLFMWVIASQFMNGILMMEKWGYHIETYMNWVKVSKYGKYMPSHGYYMQHNKETLLVGLKGTPPAEMRKSKFSGLIVKQRGARQSHKPARLYEIIEEVFPGQMYLEIFARPHNLRKGWVSMGMELPA
jgi:N6-adenosine-specific RNA methylase IME4